MALQSRNTPSKDALPLAAADDPPSTPREWLAPPLKEEFFASNDKPLVPKKGDAAKTNTLVNREALTESSSPSRASSPGVVSRPLVGSLSGRTNASPCASPKALPPGAQQTSLVVVAALATNESEIPRQNSAIPPTRSRKARTPPTLTLPSPQSLSKGEIGGSRLHHWLPWPRWVPKASIGRGSEPLPCALCILAHHGITKGVLGASLNCTIFY
jgi:hypothetical protein